MMFCLVGCGTVATHTETTTNMPLWKEPGRHYAGVRLDIDSLNDGLFGNVYDFQAFCAPIYLADLPLSSVADTVLLPFDRVHSPVTNTPPNTSLEPTATAPSVSTNK
jgi:uncharacterized protein YceK